jgi:rhamnosyltransferase
MTNAHHSKVPTVAVLMAVYNGVQWLPSQVESILSQKNVEVQLFISIDKSTDESANWCLSLADRETRVTVLSTIEHRYGSATKNFLHLLDSIDFSAFNYVSFSDQDDIWHLDKLQCACDVLQPAYYQAYSSNVFAWWENDRKKLLNKAQPLKPWDYLFESGGPGCTYVLARDLAINIQQRLRQLPHLTAQLKFHDWFCYAFARAENAPWYIDPNPSMLYRQHAHNAVGINRGWKPFIHRAQHMLSDYAFSQSVLTYQMIFLKSHVKVTIDIPSTRWEAFKLAFKAHQCRRRRRDQFYFFCLCILITVLGISKE